MDLLIGCGDGSLIGSLCGFVVVDGDVISPNKLLKYLFFFFLSSFISFFLLFIIYLILNFYVHHHLLMMYHHLIILIEDLGHILNVHHLHYNYLWMMPMLAFLSFILNYPIFNLSIGFDLIVLEVGELVVLVMEDGWIIVGSLVDQRWSLVDYHQLSAMIRLSPWSNLRLNKLICCLYKWTQPKPTNPTSDEFTWLSSWQSSALI